MAAVAETRASEEQVAQALGKCEERYGQLVRGGCDPDVAADRTFDAWDSALMGEHHCYDPRDRLFENELRTILGSSSPESKN